MKENPELIKRLNEISKKIKSEKKFKRTKFRKTLNLLKNSWDDSEGNPIYGTKDGKFTLLIDEESLNEEMLKKDTLAKNAKERVKYDRNNLNLIYLLLNTDNEEAKRFWKAFSEYLLDISEIKSKFTFQQVLKLLELVKITGDESLMNSLKHLILTNGLLTKTTNGRYGKRIINVTDDNGFNNTDVYAITEIEDEILMSITDQYRDYLKQAILEYHGIVSESGAMMDDMQPSKENIAFLENLGLVKSASYYLENEDGEKILNDRMIDPNIFCEINQIPDNPVERQRVPIEELYEDVDTSYEKELESSFESIGGFPAWIRQKNLIANLIDFREKVSDDLIEVERETQTGERQFVNFFNYLEGEIQVQDIHDSLNYLIQLLTAIQTLYEANEGHCDIDLKTLATIAGMSNVKTVVNDLISKDKNEPDRVRLTPYKEEGINPFAEGLGPIVDTKIDPQNAIKWLTNMPYRRYPLNKPILSYKYDEDITVKYLNSLTD